MEFRLFFPILSASDRRLFCGSCADNSHIMIDTKLLESSFDIYMNMVNIFLTYVTINNNTKSINDSIHIYHDDNNIEKREDSYYVTEPFFGLKYRHGKKLELKIRYKNHISMIDRMNNDGGDRRTSGVGGCSNGIEIWTKYKFGKKNAHHYKNDILSKLIDCGYDSHDLKSIDPHALFNQTMKIDKSRNRFLIGDMLFEVCHLFINDYKSASIHEHNNDNDLQGDLKITSNNDNGGDINRSINRSINTNNKSNNDVVIDDNIPSGRRLQWLSISIEHFNHLNDIKHLLQSNHPDAKNLCDIIISYNKLLINHSINILISRYLLPIASGYPLFINYLSKNIMMDETMKNDQINVWQSVVNLATHDL